MKGLERVIRRILNPRLGSKHWWAGDLGNWLRSWTRLVRLGFPSSISAQSVHVEENFMFFKFMNERLRAVIFDSWPGRFVCVHYWSSRSKLFSWGSICRGNGRWVGLQMMPHLVRYIGLLAFAANCHFVFIRSLGEAHVLILLEGIWAPYMFTHCAVPLFFCKLNPIRSRLFWPSKNNNHLPETQSIVDKNLRQNDIDT